MRTLFGALFAVTPSSVITAASGGPAFGGTTTRRYDDTT
jgi:hypothetical protein